MVKTQTEEPWLGMPSFFFKIDKKISAYFKKHYYKGVNPSLVVIWESERL